MSESGTGKIQPGAICGPLKLCNLALELEEMMLSHKIAVFYSFFLCLKKMFSKELNVVVTVLFIFNGQ